MPFTELPNWWLPPSREPGPPEDIYRTARPSTIFDKLPSADSILASLPGKVSLGGIDDHSLLQWAEHCVECAAPACYSACNMFVDNGSGKCRRFVRGIEKSTEHATVFDGAYKIMFLPWSNLLAMVDQPLQAFDGFLLQAFNPGYSPVPLLFELRARHSRKLGFIAREVLDPGFNQFFYSFDKLRGILNRDEIQTVVIAPNVAASPVTLYFPAMEFVQLNGVRLKPSGRQIKCVAVDLDNTLWQGTLVEDGAEALEINQQMVQQLDALTRRGVAVSIVSKNHRPDVDQVLGRFGLTDLFVFPQVAFSAKAVGVKNLADNLGISVDSIAFVDDSPFERAAVGSAFPGLSVLSPADLTWLMEDILAGPTTRDGGRRVARYRQEQARREAQHGYDGDYLDFLKTMQIKVRVAAADEENIDRIQELVQRTNRLNMSNRRYRPDDVLAILCDKTRYRCRVVFAKDCFGDYGLIGFYVIDTDAQHLWRVLDFMLSCRVHGRGIDVFVLTSIVQDAGATGVHSVSAELIPNGRNDELAAALQTTGFEQQESGPEKRIFTCDCRASKINTLGHIQPY